MAESDEILQALRRLKLRLSTGEIDEPSYDRLRERVLADLTADERAALGISATPKPATAATPAPGSPPPSHSPRPGTPARPSTPFSTPGPTPLGPSGGHRGGMRTAKASLSDLDLQPGSELLGQWRLIRELGRGGFGAVFEAEEMHLRERQAVKVLDPTMVAKEELLARFRREVSLMRKLVHPRIVRVYDYREDLDQSLALISMELVAEGSVKQLVSEARKRNHPLPLPLSLNILGQILEALAEAHGQGVIHRDVTPGNVLLAGGTPEQLLTHPDRDPRVKLVDFGIAGLVERTELSQKSRVLGTAAYVAPEVLDPSVEVTPAADVYGAGAVAYELLTGTPALGRFREPHAFRLELSKEANALVLSLLETAPTDRPSAAAAAAGAAGEVLRTRAEAARRARIDTHERALAAALAAQDEAASRVAARELEAHLLPGETIETIRRAATWFAELESWRREQDAARQRQSGEERVRQEAERRRLESQRQAELERAEERRKEEGREFQRRVGQREGRPEPRLTGTAVEPVRSAGEARRAGEAMRTTIAVSPSVGVSSRTEKLGGGRRLGWRGAVGIGVFALFLVAVIAFSTGRSSKRATQSDAWRDQQTGLLWTESDNGSDITWSGAKSYCEGLMLQGFSDWRLPALVELESLYNPSSFGGRYKTKGFVRLSACCAWGDELQSGDPSRAGFFDFSSSRRHWGPNDNSVSSRALCVRRTGG